MQAAEDEGGGQTVTPAEEFAMPPAAELANLEGWVHKNAHVPKQGRCTKYEEPAAEGEEGEEEEEEPASEEEGEEGEKSEGEEEEEPAEEPEEEPSPLRALSEDKELMENVKAWSICTSSSIKNLKHQVDKHFPTVLISLYAFLLKISLCPMHK